MTNVVPLRSTPDDPPFDREVSGPPPPDPLPDQGGPRGPGGDAPAPEPPRYGRVVPLGTGFSRGRKAYVFLDSDGERQMFTARDLVHRANLLSLFGGSEGRGTLMDLWPEFGRGKDTRGKPPVDFDAEAAGSELMGACGALGPAEATELRNGGVWRHGEGLLVNVGDAVLTEAGDKAPGFRDGQRIYVAGEKRAWPPPRGAGATPEEVERLAKDLKLWTFAAEHQPIAVPLLLGFIACGLYGAAIAWRPHGFLRGEFQAGKSSLCRLIAYACGAGEPAEDITPAALHRVYNARSGLIPLDEREQDAVGVEGVVKIMRGASDGDGNVKVQMDPDAGGLTTFRVAGCFLMAATTLPALTPADVSRITVLQVRAGAVDRRAEVHAAQQRARALYPKLLRRMLDAWPRWAGNWQAARAAAGRLDATSRSMDQVGALVAGWWTLTEDRPLTAKLADAEMPRFAELLTTRAASSQEGAGRLVLQHLLGSRIVISDRSSDQRTVQAELERGYRAQFMWQGASKGSEFRDQVSADVNLSQRTLGQNGLHLNALGASGRGWPWPFEGLPEPGLMIATELPGPRALFGSSDWPKLAWREPLRDLPGVRLSRRSMRFAGAGPSKVLFVPLDQLELSEADVVEGG